MLTLTQLKDTFSILKRAHLWCLSPRQRTAFEAISCRVLTSEYNYRIALGFDDTTRAALAVKGIAGKRLTYRQPHGQKPEPPEPLAADYRESMQLAFDFMLD